MVHVLLGYLDEKEGKYELKEKRNINKKFTSKIGGKPYWLDRINLPNEKNFYCTICNKLMSFLLQIYAPIDKLNNCFHRCLYLFVCLYCGDQAKCFRTQLPRSNPFYNYYLENGNDSNSELNTSDIKIESSKPYPSDILNKQETLTNSNENNSQISTPHKNIEQNEHPHEYILSGDKNIFDKKLEYFLCCKICGIPSNNKINHEICRLKEHIIFEENQIYISDEDNCESSSTGNESFSDADTEEDENEEFDNEKNKDIENINDINEKKITLNNNDKNYYINDKNNYIDDNQESNINNENRKKNFMNEENKDIENNEDNDLDISEMKAFEEIQKEIEKKREIDSVFKNYLKKIQRFPKQIIRYSYNGTVLYFSSDNTNSNKNNTNEKGESFNINKKSVPNCFLCGKKKVFEFQVLSTVINYLKLKKKSLINKKITLNSKFSIIAVFTCENNCDIFDINKIAYTQDIAEKNRYIQEYVYIQVED